MGKKQKKPGQGKEKTERKTAKATEKRARRDDKKVSEEDDIDAILVGASFTSHVYFCCWNYMFSGEYAFNAIGILSLYFCSGFGRIPSL